MSRITVTRNHDFGLEGARTKLNELTGTLAEKYGVKATPRGDTVGVSGKGIDGEVRITETTVTLDLKLGLMLRPMKGKIEAGIHRQMDKYFA